MANILGINLSGLSRTELSDRVNSFLNSDHGHYLVTPNPEIILAALHDEELFYILNQADLSLADGFGLQVAGRILREKVTRLTGADLTLELLQKAEIEKIRTVVLNRLNGLSTQDDIERALRQKYPHLDFLVLAINREVPLSESEHKKLNDFAPTLLFVTLGSPYQEKIIYHNLSNWPTLRLAIGVGGAFDFITDRVKRAPRGLRRSGLEWLWRLSQQPERIGRIYNATFVFLAKVLKARLIDSHRYRPNVACWLYKKETGKIKVLVVERQDEVGHWQLPQGGRDGESIAKAGARELREETGAEQVATRGTFPDVFYYDFLETNRHRGDRNPRFDHKQHRSDYRGQKQSLYIAEFLGEDSEIKINFWDHRAWQWADLENLITTLHPNRQESGRLFLEKFKSLNIK